jgi:hypothetical protein
VQRRDGGWRLRWAILVAGDVLACVLAYLGAFILRSLVPLPLTQGYLPGIRFAEVQHHWVEMILAQLGALYFFGLYEVRALTSSWSPSTSSHRTSPSRGRSSSC